MNRSRASRSGRLTGGVLLLSLCAACAPPAQPSHAPEPVRAQTQAPVSVEDMLGVALDVRLVLHPPVLLRDPVYGTLLTRAAALARAYAGPKTLGTTALSVLERVDEVEAALADDGDGVVILRGVPADLEAGGIVDETGKPLWRPAVGDVRKAFVELVPVDACDGAATPGKPCTAPDAALFVTERRMWLIAVGTGMSRTREALLAGRVVAPSASGAELAVLSVRGPALLRRQPRLRQGGLAPLGRSLVRASIELAPGRQGLVVSRLDYGDPVLAAGAEATARDVVTAFRHKLEGKRDDRAQDHGTPPVSGDAFPLDWLAAAEVTRSESTVTVRAPLPRSWLDALAHAGADTARAPGTHAPDADLPWDLWRRRITAPSLEGPAASDGDSFGRASSGTAQGRR